MKKGLPLIGLGILIVCYFFWYYTASAVVIGNQSFTHKDIDTLYKVEKELGDILGTSVVNSKEDVLYNLIVSALQKDILLANTVTLNQEQIIQSEETNTLLKGFYASTKQELGVEEYYRLLIEPIAVSKLFVNFYEIANTANRNALTVLATLRNNQTLEQIAAQNNIQLVNLNLAKAGNETLVTQLAQRTGIYPKPITVGDTVLVAEVTGYTDENIILKAMVFKKNTYKQFITSILDTGKIKFPFYSAYSLKHFTDKKGSILQ